MEQLLQHVKTSLELVEYLIVGFARRNGLGGGGLSFWDEVKAEDWDLGEAWEGYVWQGSLGQMQMWEIGRKRNLNRRPGCK